MLFKIYLNTLKSKDDISGKSQVINLIKNYYLLVKIIQRIEMK